MNLVDRFIHKYGRLPTEFDRDYLEMLRMSKYKILDVPKFKPAKCCNCGSSKLDDRKYVDIGLELDWYGIVYFCTLCIVDICTHIGLFEPYTKEIERLKISILQINKQLDAGSKLNADFLQTFKEVQDYFTSLRPVGDVPVSNSDTNMDSKKSSGESGIDEIKSAANAAKQGSTKSTSSSRPKNVRSLAELLESSE